MRCEQGFSLNPVPEEKRTSLGLSQENLGNHCTWMVILY